MRRFLSVLLAGLAAAVLVIGVSGPSSAAPTAFNQATLTVVISTLPPVVLPTAGGASGNVDIVKSGAAIVGVNKFPGGILGTGMVGMTSGTTPTSGMAVCVPGVPNPPAKKGCGLGGGLIVPITDPAANPIKGLQLTQNNASGNFAVGTATPMQPQPVTPGAHLRGPMALVGVNKVCLFKACTASPSANITVPVSVNGVGGTAAATGAVSVTVRGAPWTTGKQLIFPRTAMTTMGAQVNPPGNPTGMGMTTMGGTSMATIFVQGGTSKTMGGGTHVQLVTPIFISTNIPASAVVPAFAILQFVASPEPGVAAGCAAAIGALLLLGWRRRRQA
jgi:hypothetical protein